MESNELTLRPEEHVATPETIGKPFQKDRYGNYRIVVKGHASEWCKRYQLATLKVDGEIYIGVSDIHDGHVPKECVAKIEVVDEDGEPNFYRFKIIDLAQNRALDLYDVYDTLGESPFDTEEYEFFVKGVSQEDFIKVRITQFGNYQESARLLTKEEVVDYIINTFSTGEFEVYDEDNNKIN